MRTEDLPLLSGPVGQRVRRETAAFFTAFELVGSHIPDDTRDPEGDPTADMVLCAELYQFCFDVFMKCQEYFDAHLPPEAGLRKLSNVTL